MTEVAATSSPSRELHRAYSAIWSVPKDVSLIKAVEDQFASWLRGKGTWDPATEQNGYHRGPDGQELLVVHRHCAEGDSLRLRLIEANASGTWRTTVTVDESAGSSSWLRLHVTSNGGVPAKVPRLATYLLEALELRDGETWLSARPQRISISDAERVAEEVTDPGRYGLYFVAGTDDSMPFEAFAERVERWTLDTRGMSQVAVLDPGATREFAQIMGPSHDVSPWTVRTFYREVDPAIPGDGRRHRILGTRRLAGSDGAVRSILGAAARGHAAQRPVPEHLSKIDRALVRLEDRLLVEALIPSGDVLVATGSTRPEVVDPVDAEISDKTPAVAGETHATWDLALEVERYVAELDLVKEVLGLPAIDRDSLARFVKVEDTTARSADAIDRVTRQLEERRERIEDLEFERDFLRELSDDQELELSEAHVGHAKLADEVRWLRRRLAEQGDRSGSFAPLPPTELTNYPADFSELVESVGQLEIHGVVFTGNSEVASALSDQDPLGRVAGVAWDCLLTLCDYVRARQEGASDGGVKQYLENTPQGYRSVPRKKFAFKETATTMQAWGNQRSFPVPTSVDATGKAVMQAHFRLGHVGMVSPRMYYLDNFSRDKKIYVGYIGAHLRNTHTN